MPRRAVLLIALICLALLGGAVAPWTVSSGAMITAIASQLRDGYGLDLTVHGRRTIAFLPVPRLKFEDVSVKTLDGTPIVDGGDLRGEFRIVPLLVGRLELTEVWLSRSRLTVALAPGGGTLAGPVARLREQALAPGRSDHVRRLILTDGEVAVQQGDARSLVRGVNVVVNWPRTDGPVDASATFEWRGDLVSLQLRDLRPAAVAAQQSSPFAVRASAPQGTASASGEILAGADLRMAGRMEFQTRSVRGLSRWTGMPFPLAPVMEALAGEGEFTLARGVVAWPGIRLALGSDRLEGALAASLVGDRPVVSGTLAADRLDLTDFLGPLLQARTPAGGWTGDPINLDAATAADVDIRLSATDARVGSAKLDDMAAGILVRAGRIEASLGRAGLNRGIIKGRLALAALGGKTDLKLQTSFERVDVGTFLSDLGRNRWIGGLGQGTVQVEGVGGSAGELMRGLHGRIVAQIRQGELVGMGVGEALKRLERRPLSASQDWKGGRTPFDQASLVIAVNDGVGEVVEGGFLSSLNRGTLQGRISFGDRWVGLKCHVDATAPAASPGFNAGLVFDIGGSWDEIAVVPDVRALIQRSDAAQPLLIGPESSAGQARGLGLGAATPR